MLAEHQVYTTNIITDDEGTASHEKKKKRWRKWSFGRCGQQTTLANMEAQQAKLATVLTKRHTMASLPHFPPLMYTVNLEMEEVD